MVLKHHRDTLSMANKIRRSYYELLRDTLDQQLLNHSLVASYHNFKECTKGYPFVEKKELKPRARTPDKEYKRHNTFLVIFTEDVILPIHKKYLHFFDHNKTTLRNLKRSKSVDFSLQFDHSARYFDASDFASFLEALLPVDYALLIQRHPSSRLADRYYLTHYHVRVDWPIMEAAEELSKDLRYISKDLYEKGDKYAENCLKKFFEYYGLTPMSGGRRTAAIIAAQYVKKLQCLATVYAGSSESRSMIRFSEQGISKSVLVRLNKDQVKGIAETHHLTPPFFRKKYAIALTLRYNVGILQARYDHTDSAKVPMDGKMRELNPDLNWLTVSGQYLLPRPGVRQFPPLPVNLIYT